MIQFFIYLKLVLLSTLTLGIGTQKQVKISPKELSSWQTVDKGKTSIEGDALIMEEISGSDGYILISPEQYTGDYVLTYKVKAMSESSVLITLFSAAQKGNTGPLQLPAANATPRQIWDWRSNMEHYNLTFNNSSHGITPFLFKNLSPKERPFNERLPNNIATVGKWHDVEIGKSNSRVWFKLDGKEYFNVADEQPLKSGHLMFRVSGTTGENVIFAKAAIKDVVISFDN